MKLTYEPCFSTDGEAGLGAGALQPDCLQLATTVLSYLSCRCKHAPRFTPHPPSLLAGAPNSGVIHCLFSSLCSHHQDCQVGLNFAAEQEADTFQNAVEEKISQRQTRQGQRGHERFIFRMTEHKVFVFNDAICKLQNVYVCYCAHALLK